MLERSFMYIGRGYGFFQCFFWGLFVCVEVYVVFFFQYVSVCPSYLCYFYCSLQSFQCFVDSFLASGQCCSVVVFYCIVGCRYVFFNCMIQYYVQFWFDFFQEVLYVVVQFCSLVVYCVESSGGFFVCFCCEYFLYSFFVIAYFIQFFLYFLYFFFMGFYFLFQGFYFLYLFSGFFVFLWYSSNVFLFIFFLFLLFSVLFC